MRFAKIVFLIAGVWGVLILMPLYFLHSSGGVGWCARNWAAAVRLAAAVRHIHWPNKYPVLLSRNESAPFAIPEISQTLASPMQFRIATLLRRSAEAVGHDIQGQETKRTR